MRKYKYVLIIFLIIPSLLKAENNLVLPKAGLTPNSPVYFMDLLGEKLQEWLTFNPVSKAKLSAGFATERVAEVQELLKNREVDAQGLNTALNNLAKNSADVLSWLAKGKEKNINVDNTATDLNNKLSANNNKLDEILVAAIQSFATWRSDLQLLFTQAGQSNQTSSAEDFKKQLEKVDNQINLISSKISENKAVEPREVETKENTPERPIVTTPSAPKPVISNTDFNAARIKAEATLQGIRQLKSRIDDLADEAGVEIDEETFENYNLFYPQINKNINDGHYIEAEEIAAGLRENLVSIEQELKDYVNN